MACRESALENDEKTERSLMVKEKGDNILDIFGSSTSWNKLKIDINKLQNESNHTMRKSYFSRKLTKKKRFFQFPEENK